MIDRFALSFLCIELDRNVRTGVTGLYILLTPTKHQDMSRARPIVTYWVYHGILPLLINVGCCNV